MASLKNAAKQTLAAMVSGAGRDTASTRPLSSAQKTLPKEMVEKLEKRLSESKQVVQRVPLNLIHLGSNIRTNYDQDALQVLANSLLKDGLIQFPTLFLRKTASEGELVCANGHRRIKAARMAGWEAIECVIIDCKSDAGKLYHVLNANMRENVFYLDLATAYELASQLGKSDPEIAKRIGVSPRTVAWYRRLATFPPKCAQLAHEYPKLFSAIWAIQLARKGALPAAPLLHAEMQKMVATNKTWLPSLEQPSPPASEDPARQKRNTAKTSALVALKEELRHQDAEQYARNAYKFLQALHQSGVVPKRTVEKIKRAVWDGHAPS